MPEILPSRAHKIASFLYVNCRFYSWPYYYRTLLLCRNPYLYSVRFRQVIFCVVNRIKFSEYIEIISCLNPYVSFLSDRLKTKLNDLFHYIVSQGLLKPRSITSYNFNLDTLTTINGKEIFLDEFVEEPIDDPINHSFCDRHLKNLGVKNLLSFDRYYA